jgi:hypothetical protein
VGSRSGSSYASVVVGVGVGSGIDGCVLVRVGRLTGGGLRA